MDEDKLEKIINLLQDIKKWMKIQGWREIRKILLETLDDDLSKQVYHYSDGRSTREIAEKTPVSHTTISKKYWERWSKIRPKIVEPISVQRGMRYKKIFLLEDFGISIPGVTEKSESNESGT
jgi:hypothetical protein